MLIASQEFNLVVENNINLFQHVKEEVKRIDIGKEAAIEAEVKAARERAIVPLEIRMKQFRDLLAEKGVSCIVFIPLYNQDEIWHLIIENMLI